MKNENFFVKRCWVEKKADKHVFIHMLGTYEGWDVRGRIQKGTNERADIVDMFKNDRDYFARVNHAIFTTEPMTLDKLLRYKRTSKAMIEYMEDHYLDFLSKEVAKRLKKQREEEERKAKARAAAEGALPDDEIIGAPKDAEIIPANATQ